jgi:hypothetical protein
MLRAGVRIKASWKNRLIVVLALLGDSSQIRRGAVPVAEGEAAFAGEPYVEEDDSRGWDGCLLDGARGRRLDYLRCGVANRAICMGQPIRMKVRLLNRGARKEKDRAQDGKQKTSARFECPILTCFSHLYPFTIRHLHYSPKQPNQVATSNFPC